MLVNQIVETETLVSPPDYGPAEILGHSIQLNNLSNRTEFYQLPRINHCNFLNEARGILRHEE